MKTYNFLNALLIYECVANKEPKINSELIVIPLFASLLDIFFQINSKIKTLGTCFEDANKVPSLSSLRFQRYYIVWFEIFYFHQSKPFLFHIFCQFIQERCGEGYIWHWFEKKGRKLFLYWNFECWIALFVFFKNIIQVIKV